MATSVKMFLLFVAVQLVAVAAIYERATSNVLAPDFMPVPETAEPNEYDDPRPLLSHDIVQQVKEAGVSWAASAYQEKFSGLSVGKARRLLGPPLDYRIHVNGELEFRNDVNDTYLLPLKRIHGSKTDLPERFDAREKWFDCESIPLIRDQGNCGACWAFGTTGAISDRTCIGTKGRDQALISARDVMSCCENCTDTGNPCQNGIPEAAYLYWNDTGIVTGGNWMSQLGCQPYPIPINLNHSRIHDPPPVCRDHCTEPTYKVEYLQDKRRAIDVYRLEPLSTIEMQFEIMRHGPISVTFDVYQDFFHYTEGVYQHVTGELIGGHCVRIIGWGHENGTDYWLAANSWNMVWGLHGFFKIRRGTNEVGFEQLIMAGLTDPNWKPTWEGRPQ